MASKQQHSVFTLLSFACLPFLAACAQPDPVWDLPCEERPAREVIVGTGEGNFISAEEGDLHIQYGSQGGQHIWIAIRLRGFGPEINASYGIVDAKDPSMIYSGPNIEHIPLNYNPEEEASETFGLFGYLNQGWDEETNQPLPGPAGQSVTLWADVSDQCTSVPVHGEAAAKVE